MHINLLCQSTSTRSSFPFVCVGSKNGATDFLGSMLCSVMLCSQTGTIELRDEICCSSLNHIFSYPRFKLGGFILRRNSASSNHAKTLLWDCVLLSLCRGTSPFYPHEKARGVGLSLVKIYLFLWKWYPCIPVFRGSLTKWKGSFSFIPVRCSKQTTEKTNDRKRTSYSADMSKYASIINDNIHTKPRIPPSFIRLKNVY